MGRQRRQLLRLGAALCAECGLLLAALAFPLTGAWRVAIAIVLSKHIAAGALRHLAALGVTSLKAFSTTRTALAICTAAAAACRELWPRLIDQQRSLVQLLLLLFGLLLCTSWLEPAHKNTTYPQ